MIEAFVASRIREFLPRNKRPGFKGIAFLVSKGGRQLNRRIRFSISLSDRLIGDNLNQRATASSGTEMVATEQAGTGSTLVASNQCYPAGFNVL